ncbi:hypothetical protein SASPL_117636 [Salvia splendens]|uniref:THO complex subunit 6 n=1 Tax=Salvia splendens TaxID=180675 RepID=A0A8X8XYQ0_SALSN|nr:hypothetical protein SASPL_117636 [Salvia splendens]
MDTGEGEGNAGGYERMEVEINQKLLEAMVYFKDLNLRKNCAGTEIGQPKNTKEFGAEEMWNHVFLAHNLLAQANTTITVIELYFMWCMVKEVKVCGKGQSLSLWNLPARECFSVARTQASVQDALFDENHILAVGAEPLLTRLNMNGDIISQIKCAPTSAFSVSLHPSGVAAVSGYGALVDRISQFGSHLCTFRCGGL